MAKVLGLREQRVQFFYDTDFVTHGAVTNQSDVNFAMAQKNLFSDARAGNLLRTNLQGPGQLLSDQTFLTFAVRHEVMFYNVATSATYGTATAAGFDTLAQLSIWTMNTCTFQFQVDTKVEFEGPITMTPAGGGPWGFVSDSAAPLITNGEPDAPSIYVLPLPIAITKRQAIAMIEKKYAFGGTDVAAEINAADCGKLLRAYIDGYNTRDVQ
mgnify:CR=1 FL=1|tara:strand:+ start:2064 stop:2699 length:636 start_codon:yes stop_codon:yes gene_type:complete